MMHFTTIDCFRGQRLQARLKPKQLECKPATLAEKRITPVNPAVHAGKETRGFF